jgi:hypothetical protein
VGRLRPTLGATCPRSLRRARPPWGPAPPVARRRAVDRRCPLGGGPALDLGRGARPNLPGRACVRPRATPRMVPASGGGPRSAPIPCRSAIRRQLRRRLERRVHHPVLQPTGWVVVVVGHLAVFHAPAEVAAESGRHLEVDLGDGVPAAAPHRFHQSVERSGSESDADATSPDVPAPGADAGASLALTRGTLRDRALPPSGGRHHLASSLHHPGPETSVVGGRSSPTTSTGLPLH